MRRLKKDYKPPRVTYSKKVIGSKTVPNQSMSIKEIVRRYVRGIPVDVIQRDPVYHDQEQYDLEKLSRMDFADKHEFAAEQKRQADELYRNLQEEANERAQGERERAQAERDRKAADESGTGIDPLDNTMPVDTKRKNPGK